MRIYLLLLLFVVPLFSSASSKEITIHQKQFIFKEKAYDLYGDKGITLTIYKNEMKPKNEIFSFIMENKSGPCSNKAVQEGVYEINGSKITFYSHWRRQGKAYTSPVGDRIQVYEVENNGTLKKISSRLYIERERRNYDEESGMKYLFTAPQTEEQRNALAHYIKKVEKIFEGEFVYEEEARELAGEVDAALRRKRMQQWK